MMHYAPERGDLVRIHAASAMLDPPRRGRRYLIAMVGLPARGKTYTARKLCGYLTWLGYPTRSWNLGERRRERLGAGQSAAFFDPANRAAAAQREALADECLDEALTWVAAEGRIAILDATNSTRARRAHIRARCARARVSTLFVELRHGDPSTVDVNVREGKLSLPDYAGRDPEHAIADFRARIAHYERGYVPLGPPDGSWIRVEDRGREVILHQARGWIIGRIASLLTNLAVGERPIWLTRHGESVYNVSERIGGDSELTERGREFARALAEHVRDSAPELPELDVWTSTARRAIDTAAALGRDAGRWRALDEIDAGVCDGCTYEEIAARWPEEFTARGRDKLRYRYPGGESYEDVIARVDRVILELESFPTPVLVVAHRAVVRALYAYFVQLPLEDAPHVEVPLHTVIKLVPTAYGCRETRVALPPAVGARV